MSGLRAFWLDRFVGMRECQSNRLVGLVRRILDIGEREKESGRVQDRRERERERGTVGVSEYGSKR